MPDTIIPNLWPTDIAVDVVPPVAILRSQAGMLAQVTKGILEAEVTTITEGARVQHRLDLIAPALNGYRHRLLTATHAADMPYPVTVEAECFIPQTRHPLPPPGTPVAPAGSDSKPQSGAREAATQHEFIDLIGQVLRSTIVRSLIQSLILRSNEANISPPPPTTNGGTVPGVQ